MGFPRLLWKTFVSFTELKNRMYQFILIFQPLVFLFLIKFMLLIRPSVNESKYIVAVSILSTWNYVLYSSGSSLIMEKWMGTFDIIMASRTSLFQIVLSKAINNALLGLSTLLITLVYAKLFFGFHIFIADLPQFVLAVLSLAIGLIAIGLILSILFALFTNVFEYQNLIVYPIMILTGIFYPVDHMPLFVRMIADLLPMTWSVESIYATLNSTATQNLHGASIGLIVSLIYLAVAFLLMKRIELKFRESSELGVF